MLHKAWPIPSHSVCACLFVTFVYSVTTNKEHISSAIELYALVKLNWSQSY